MSRYILFTMILPKRQSSKPISLQFSESNEYMFGGIHDNTGSQVTIREWPSKSVQSGRGGQNRGSFQADASKVPGCRNAKDVRPSPITTLRLWGTTLLCLLASTTTSLSTSATASSDLTLNHAITTLLPPPTRIAAILPRVRAIVSRIVTTTVLARPATILGPHAFAPAPTSPPTRAITATESPSINSRVGKKIVQADRSIALIGLVDFSGLDRILGSNAHDQASFGLDPSPPWYAAAREMKRNIIVWKSLILS